MQIQIITVSRRYPTWVETAYEQYSKRISKIINLKLKTIKPISNANDTEIKLDRNLSLEAKKIQNFTLKKGLKVVLSDKGTNLNTQQLYQYIENCKENGMSLNFIIGGPEGLHSTVYENSDFTLSLSSCTFAHPLALVVLIEQIYRVISIAQNHPYHRG